MKVISVETQAPLFLSKQKPRNWAGGPSDLLWLLVTGGPLPRVLKEFNSRKIPL